MYTKLSKLETSALLKYFQKLVFSYMNFRNTEARQSSLFSVSALKQISHDSFLLLSESETMMYNVRIRAMVASAWNLTVLDVCNMEPDNIALHQCTLYRYSINLPWTLTQLH